jgi:RND family efflux transporter MFP subunit
MNRTRLSLIAGAGSVLLAAVLLHACSGNSEAEPPVRPVRMITVGSAAVAPAVELAGEVRARVESRLGFRVSGKITSRTVEAGARVKRGQELARIDPRDYQLARQAAQSQRVAAEQELAKARTDLARFEELRRQGYVSVAELDRARVQLATMEALHEQAASTAALEGNRLADTVLRADADGVVMSVEADAGEVVSAGQPVVVVAQDGPREIAVEFPENRTQVAMVAQAEVALWAQPGVSWPAKLRELAAAADPVTRTFRARYSVQAPAGALQLGQSASLRLKVPAMGQGIRLPTTAVFEQQGQSMVWVYDDATQAVSRVPVQIAGLEGTDILVAGLPDGARVVTAGVHVLKDGQRVRPLEAALPHAAAAKATAAAPAAAGH